MKTIRICILFLAFIKCFPWLDLLIWFIVSCLVSFVVLVGAACKGAAIRGLLSTCKAQRKAAGNRAPLRGQNPAPEVPGSQSLAQERRHQEARSSPRSPRGQNPPPEVPGSQNLAQEPQDARIQPQSFQEARASENRGRVGK